MLKDIFFMLLVIYEKLHCELVCVLFVRKHGLEWCHLSTKLATLSFEEQMPGNLSCRKVSSYSIQFPEN